MSDVHAKPQTFFDLYAAGLLNAGDIDDFVGAWHRSGPEETRELHDYLGLTATEYELWLYAPGLLPALATARHTGNALTAGVAQYVTALNDDPATRDGTATFRLTNWLRRQAVAP